MDRLILILCLLLREALPAVGCLGGGMSSMRGRPGRLANREPLLYGQYVPNRSELSVGASGPTEGRIDRDSPEFQDLAESQNVDIVFKDEEGTGADRFVSKRCKDKLDGLAIMVMNQWPGIKLRVTEAWDDDGSHASDSLHYEGRAVDITTSDRDRRKLSLLGRLAYEAGFDYVSYESKHHIHASVKSDAAESSFASGCFASDSYVTMADNSVKVIQDLRIGDEVLTTDPYTGETTRDTVIMFLDSSTNSKMQFTKIIHEDGEITLTDYHLIYASLNKKAKDSAAIFAKDLTDDHYILRSHNGTLVYQKVIGIYRVLKHGYFAPLTLSGNIIVNDVLSSCYASVGTHWLGHFAMLPARLFHALQESITPYTESLLAEYNITRSDGVHWYAYMLKSVFPYLLS